MTMAITQSIDPPLHLWHDRLVKATASAPSPERIVQIYQQCTSTQDVARRLIQLTPEHQCDGLDGAIIVADVQTRGRGRRGRIWHSTAGGTLTFSVLQPMDATSPGGGEQQVHEGIAELTHRTAQAVMQAVQQLPPNRAEASQAQQQTLRQRLRIKAPNDLMVGNDKLAGVLIETAHDAAGRRIAIIGVGINVHHTPRDVPHATSLAAIGITSDRLTTAEALIRKLAAR